MHEVYEVCTLVSAEPTAADRLAADACHPPELDPDHRLAAECARALRAQRRSPARM
jgi:hypothetical protein